MATHTPKRDLETSTPAKEEVEGEVHIIPSPSLEALRSVRKPSVGRRVENLLDGGEGYGAASLVHDRIC